MLTKEKVDRFFAYMRDYQRPGRMCIWVIIISIAFLKCFFKQPKGSVDPIAEVMILGMFTDLGVYGVSRTVEKIKQSNVDANKDIVDKVTDTDTKGQVNTNIHVESPPAG